MDIKSKGFHGWLVAGGLLIAIVAAVSCIGPRADSVPAIPQTNFDRDFMGLLLHHYDEEAQMITACAQKAQRQELLTFCRELSNRQQSAANSLRKWLVEWFKAAPKSDTSEHSSEQFRDLRDRMGSSSGPQFEESFLRAMRVHHRSGLKQTQDCEARATHQELREFCSRQTGEQQKEEKQIDVWVCKWFNDCGEKH